MNKCIECGNKTKGFGLRCYSCAKKGTNIDKKYNIPKDYLIQEYTENKKSPQQIAKIINCSKWVIMNRLQNFNISIRNLNEAMKGINKGEKRPKISKRMKLNNPTKRSEVRKKMRENHANFKKENNPFYGKHHTEESKSKMSLSLGGTGIPHENSGYPIEFLRIKTKIYKRDNYTCQLCNAYPIKCEAHHIDYNKMNCDEYNLITLCRSCNMKVNFNKQHWTEYFQEKLGVLSC